MLRSHEAAEGRGRVTLVPAEGNVTPAAQGHATHGVLASGGSLLRTSVPARLALVGVTASLLWLAVWWALT